jgi:plasmid stabilization system protein ParE
MPKNKYEIEYLPVAKQDLAEIITYIAVDLAAPQAAANLLEKIEQAIKSLKTFPYAHAIYQPAVRKHPAMPFEFRALVVNSYLVFY